MPTSEEDYWVIFSGATADTETVYSLGIGVNAPDSTGFTDSRRYEPNDTEPTATMITGNQIIAYLHKNDIDFYRVNLTGLGNITISPPTTSFATFTWSGNWTQTGDSQYTSNSIGHSSSTWETLTINASAQCRITVTLTASSESNYDFGYASTLDGSQSTSSYQFRVSGTQSRTYTYTVSSGTHYLYFGYAKDSSAINGNDNVSVEVYEVLQIRGIMSD